jgi:hypothetical protein
MISCTKAEIRGEFRDRYTRVIHKGDWLDRIREALGAYRYSRAWS